MTQIDLLTKNVFSITPKIINAIVSKGTISYRDSEAKTINEK